jgi:alkylhydroperoxidase family enzyme
MQYPTRVQPVDFEILTEKQKQVRVKMGVYGEDGTYDMMRTFLNFPEFTRSIGRLGSRVTITTELPSKMAALASLRTAWLCDCEYLWAVIAKETEKLGVTEADKQAITSGDYQALNGYERIVVEAVDEMHETHYLSEEKWYRIGCFGPTAVMDVMMTYSFFLTLSVSVNSMGVQLDSGLTGWGVTRDPNVTKGTGRAPIRSPRKRVFEADYALLTPEQQEQAIRLGRRGKPTTSKLQKAMINYPAFGRAMCGFGKRGIDTSSLEPRVWQLAGMRTVWLCDSEYLWSQHRKACLNLGVTDEDLLGVVEGPGSQNLKGFDRIIVQAVDDMYYGNRLSDEAWEAFAELGPEAVTDLIIVYGLYVLQSCVARNFGTTLEPNSLGYLPELEPYRSNQQRG